MIIICDNIIFNMENIISISTHDWFGLDGIPQYVITMNIVKENHYIYFDSPNIRDKAFLSIKKGISVDLKVIDISEFI